MRLDGIEAPHLVIVRTRREIKIVTGDVFGTTHAAQRVHAVFFLVSPEGDPGQHLRMLAQLAARIDQPDFIERWLAAGNEVRLREVFLRDDRYMSLRLEVGEPAHELTGLRIRDLDLPEETLVAAIRRRGATIVPRGGTVLEEEDRLLVLGEAAGIRALEERFGLRAEEGE